MNALYIHYSMKYIYKYVYNYIFLQVGVDGKLNENQFDDFIDLLAHSLGKNSYIKKRIVMFYYL
jgi:hypothetical protein